MINKKIKIVETILRDGQQSLLATRMRTKDMIPALEQLDNIGFHALEAWGGATFDSCIRFLNEDPWQRLRTLKKHLKKTPIQMLLRGQNILGYKHYADDVVEEFVKRSVYNGVGIVRIFDALNDVRNLQTAMKATKKAGAHAQGAIVYTISPYSNSENFLKVAEDLIDLGADSICIKDMAGLLTPYKAYELVTSLKEKIKVPLEIHSHCTSGMASMMYLKSIEAGVDIIDTTLSAFASAPTQPSTESMIATLSKTKFDTELEIKDFLELARYFTKVKDDLKTTFNLETQFSQKPEVLTFQLPGGMMSNLKNQLKTQGNEDKYDAVLKEMPIVRAELGYPPLVTPTSQIVGSMALINVLLDRYKMIPVEVKKLVKGLYGKTPGPIDSKIIELVLRDEKQITYRPADIIKPQLELFKTNLAKEGFKNPSSEDLLTYALFPEIALEYFKNNNKY